MEFRERAGEVGIADYFRVLYRRRWVGILTFSVVMISVAIHTLLAVPQYEASGLIEIQDEKTRPNVMTELLQIGKAVPIQAEMEVIKSRTLAEFVVDELKLDQRIFEQSPVKLRVEMEEMDIHNRLKGKVFSIEFTDDEGGFEVSSDRMGYLGKGKLSEKFNVENLSFRLMCDNFKAGDSFKFMVYPYRGAVASIQGKTEVRKIGDSTGLIRIIYRSQYPEKARDIVNKIIEIYRRKNVEDKTAEASQTLNFIKGQLDVIREDLTTSEENLNKFKSENGVMMLDAEAVGLIDSLAKLEMEKSQIQLEKFQYNALSSSLGNVSGAIELPNFTKENTVLSNLAIKLVELGIQKNNLLADLTPKHPAVIALQSQIDSLQQDIKDLVKNTVNSLSARHDSLSQVIEQYNDQLKQLPEKEKELASLKRNSTVAAEIYTFLLQKYEEARIAKAATISNIRVIDLAVVPQTPISPNMRLNLLLGLIAGILLGIGVAFFLEFIDDSLKTVEEVERFIKLPLYGIIPRIPESFIDVDGTSPVSANLVTHYSPKSPIAEAFRTMRTNIHFADPDHTLTSLLVTSASPSEGKSTIVSNLAITIANTGRKTVIVDCDLRKPNLHNIFEVARDPGLTNVLSGEMTLQDALKVTKVENLLVLPSGPIPPNPTEILDSQAMRNLSELFKTEFDMVLLDSPPVVAVTDAAILSDYVSGVLLVVELGRSRGTGVNRAIDLLNKVKANLLGLVTNNISSGYKYDYGYYYYYYYSADGEKKRNKRHRTRYGY